jgi:hypothetical protein
MDGQLQKAYPCPNENQNYPWAYPCPNENQNYPWAYPCPNENQNYPWAYRIRAVTTKQAYLR